MRNLLFPSTTYSCPPPPASTHALLIKSQTLRMTSFANGSAKRVPGTVNQAPVIPPGWALDRVLLPTGPRARR